MTSQTKYLIEFSDVLAFAFRCKECGITVSVPITGNVKANKFEKCPSCDEPWLVNNEDTLASTFNELRSHLRGMGENMKRRDAAKGGFSLAIEISVPASSDKG